MTSEKYNLDFEEDVGEQKNARVSSVAIITIIRYSMLF
ncbi:hypothetical protein AK89_11680 [Enterococcus mundtii CRL35]|nr:hypothetical protein AK89_11680 [Enterococcus mundtii CRL35]